MGRSFAIIEMAVKDILAKWLKVSRALKRKDQIYGQIVAEMTMKHLSKAFYALHDPLEVTVFSILVEITKGMDKVIKQQKV